MNIMIPPALNFGSPFWLWGLVAIPIMMGVFLRAERIAAQRLMALLPEPRLRAQLTGAASAARRRWRYVFLLLGFAGLLLAVAQPRWGYELRESHRRGLDVIVIVDVSKSMLATDIAPSRLARAKLALQDLVPRMNGDRLGLVAFAGSAFLQAPLTIDYDAVLNAAEELDTDLIPVGGTNIGGAIDLALQAFGTAETGNRAILLMSDGEPTSDTDQADGAQAAARAADAGVKVFSMGFGTTAGSVIQLATDNGADLVRDLDGQIVRTRLNESGLKEIARVGNGFYVHYENGGSALQTVIQDGFSQLKTAQIDARLARRPIERYQWPLAIALACLSLGSLLGERRKPAAPATSEEASATRPGIRRRTAAAVLGWTALAILNAHPAHAATQFATDATKPDPSDAMGLYNAGHYDEAYEAFEELSRENPGVDNLQFDAGASAYLARRYDEALDAFGKALTSTDPSLQAKSHYNFGNALFRRGEAQKDRRARIGDWRDAIQHYDTTLGALKAKPPHTDDTLAADTSYNRDLVQHRLDEELKQAPRQQPRNQPDQRDKPDNQGQQQQKQSPQQGQPDSPGRDQQHKNGNGSPSQAAQQPAKAGPSGPPEKQADRQNLPTGQPPQPPQSGQAPDLTSAPNQDKPRQRGDFHSQPNQTDGKPSQPLGEENFPDAAEESGKMSPAQARALLQSLKDEDAQVNLNENEDTRRKRDEPVTKDW